MKIFLSFLSGLALLLLVAVFMITRTVAPTSGKHQLRGLSSETKVFRDEFGVPHIEASNKPDAYRALGFLQASDRLFQMELLRRIGSGTLSEVLGKDLLQTDILLRSLRLKKTASNIIERNYKNWPKELKEEIIAFLEGVNEYALTMPLPLEFLVLGIKPERFTLEDSIAVGGYMALSFAEALLIDPLHSDLADELSKEKLSELFIENKADLNSILPRRQSAYFRNMRKALEGLEENVGLFHGSNSWVVSSARSKSGKPLLCNDPHVAFSLPGIWYEAHIKTPDFELYGHYVPLSPYTPMGNNEKIGFAVTMAEVDDLDLYFEKIEDGQVMYKNKWTPLIVEKELIKVKDEKDFQFDLKITPHGPLLDESNMGVQGKSMAIKWSYHHPENDTVLALYKLSIAKDVKEFKEAISHGASPALNVSWVDSKDNIAWKIMAKIPIRPKNIGSKAVLEGWHGKHDYIGYLPASENPELVNPKTGFIASANYVPKYNGSHPMPGYYQASERFERIEKILSSKEKWDLKTLSLLQTDEVVETHSWMIPILLKDFEGKNILYREEMRLLKNWDGLSDTKSAASTLYHFLSLTIIKNLLIDELGLERYKVFSRTADIWHFYKHILTRPNSKWWDDVRTEKIEDMEDILAASIEETTKFLSENFGDSPKTWSWGRLHTLEYPHPFGKKKPLDKIFNRGPFPVGGGFFQINNMSSTRSDFNFNVTLGPSVRRLIDFAKPREALGILPSGNSGNILSSFYDDQIEMFLRNEYRPATLNWDTIRKTSDLLILQP